MRSRDYRKVKITYDCEYKTPYLHFSHNSVDMWHRLPSGLGVVLVQHGKAGDEAIMNKRKFVYVGIFDDNVLFYESTLDSAKSKSEELMYSGDCEYVTILCINRALIIEYPPEQIITSEMNLSELLDDEM